MKRKLFTIIISLLSCTFAWASLKLDIELVPGTLKEEIKEKYAPAVVDLRLTGDLADEDFYYIRDYMTSLKRLVLKETKVDTIPERAFYEHPALEEIHLPLDLIYIAEEAFTNCRARVYVTGNYPNEPFNIGTELAISGDNERLYVDKDGHVYSADKKILYRGNPDDHHCELEEGLEIIEKYQFANCGFAYVVLPSTLKEIKDHAFENAFWELATGTSNHYGHSMVVRAKVPPRLGTGVFNFYTGDYDKPYCTLIVPPGCTEAYQNADPRWEEAFESIEEGYYPYDTSSIHAASEQSLEIHTNNGIMTINNTGTCRLCIYDIAGRCIKNCIVENNITIGNLPAGMYIYRLQGSDIAESGKFVIE